MEKVKISKEIQEQILSFIQEGNLSKLKQTLSKLAPNDAKKILHSRKQREPSALIVTPLILSIQRGHQNTTTFLLDEYQVDVEQTKDTVDMTDLPTMSQENETALWHAIESGNIELINMLVQKYKANVHYSAVGSATPLEYASYLGKINVIECILSMFGESEELNDVFVRGTGEKWCLFRAIANKNKCEVIEMLLKAGASINQVSKNGGTALHMAAYYGLSDIEAVLVEHGASVNVKDRFGFSPLQVAAISGHEDSFTYLLELQQHRNELQRQEYITALEMMGAALGIMFSEQANRTKCYQYLRKAIEERFKKDTEALVKIPLAPQDRFGYRLEHKTVSELHKLRGVQFEDTAMKTMTYDEFPLARESLIILERILGPDHPYIAYKLASLIKLQGDGMDIEVAVCFMKRILDILKELFVDDQDSLYGMVLRIIKVQTFLKMYQGENCTQQSLTDLKNLVYSCTEMHRSQTHWQSYSQVSCYASDKDNVYYQMIELSLESMFYTVVHLSQRTKLFRQFKMVIAKFVYICDLLVQGKESVTGPLHILFTKQWPQHMYQEVFFVRVTKLLLECNALPNSVDSQGMTPLDRLNACTSLSIEIKTKCMKILVDKGAKTLLSQVLKTHSLW